MSSFRRPDLALGELMEAPRGQFDAHDPMGELIDIARMRSQAHADVNLFHTMQVSPEDSINHELRGELDEAQGLLARWAIMEAFTELRTVDLAQIENRGDWAATQQVEEDVLRLAHVLTANGFSDGLIPRHSDEAKRRITIHAEQLASDGLVLVRRKRLMLATYPQPVEFRDIRPGPDGRHPKNLPLTGNAHLEIDKVSEFVLDVDGLEKLEPRAGREVRAIADRGIAEEVTNHGRGLLSPWVIEAAIDTRDETLSPVITTYYADRKLRDVRAWPEAS